MQYYAPWCVIRDLNPGPTGYEPTALPTELMTHLCGLLPALENKTLPLLSTCEGMLRIRRVVFCRIHRTVQHI